jgi:hypothetical protein
MPQLTKLPISKQDRDRLTQWFLQPEFDLLLRLLDAKKLYYQAVAGEELSKDKKDTFLQGGSNSNERLQADINSTLAAETQLLIDALTEILGEDELFEIELA